jgi:nitrite reductase/ring-hydroxylating ferredoxin subunit
MEVRIAETKALPPGTMLGVQDQGQNILVSNLAGNYYAIGNICTHEGCTLSDGTLTG